jgi:hypothetical protein
LLPGTCRGQPSVYRRCTGQVLGIEIKKSCVGGVGGGVHSFVVKGEVPVHAIKAYGGVEVKPHAFVTSLD